MKGVRGSQHDFCSVTHAAAHRAMPPLDTPVRTAAAGASPFGHTTAIEGTGQSGMEPGPQRCTPPSTVRDASACSVSAATLTASSPPAGTDGDDTVTEGDGAPFVPPVAPPSSLLGVRSLPHAPAIPAVAAFSLRGEAQQAADEERTPSGKLVAAGAAAEAMGPEQRIEYGLPPLMIGSNAAPATPTGTWELCYVLHIVTVAEAILGADDPLERGHAQKHALLVIVNFQSSVLVVPMWAVHPSTSELLIGHEHPHKGRDPGLAPTHFAVSPSSDVWRSAVCFNKAIQTNIPQYLAADLREHEVAVLVFQSLRVTVSHTKTPLPREVASSLGVIPGSRLTPQSRRAAAEAAPFFESVAKPDSASDSASTGSWPAVAKPPPDARSIIRPTSS